MYTKLQVLSPYSEQNNNKVGHGDTQFAISALREAKAGGLQVQIYLSTLVRFCIKVKDIKGLGMQLSSKVSLGWISSTIPLNIYSVIHTILSHFKKRQRMNKRVNKIHTKKSSTPICTVL